MNKIHPWYITGFTDSEGTFSCYIQKMDPLMEKISVTLEYKVTQKSHSESVLYDIKNYFSAGSVVIDNRKTDTKKYHITNLELILNNIIPHFDKYPCVTSKNLNYQDWKEVAILISKNKHFTKKGVEDILNLLSKMNTKRSFEDKYDYCRTISENINLAPSWVQGFLDGEATFYIYLAPTLSCSAKEGIEVRPKISCDPSLEVAQNSHDVAILLALKTFFKGGYIKPKYKMNSLEECMNSRSVNRFIFRSPIDSIVKFLTEYPLKTRKRLDFEDWTKIINLKNQKAHKNVEGFSERLKIEWITIGSLYLVLEPYAMKVARTVLREKICCKTYLSLNRP